MLLVTVRWLLAEFWLDFQPIFLTKFACFLEQSRLLSIGKMFFKRLRSEFTLSLTLACVIDSTIIKISHCPVRTSNCV